MDVNELCVSPDRIWSSIAFGGSCGNYNAHSLVDSSVPQFGRPAKIGVGW